MPVAALDSILQEGAVKTRHRIRRHTVRRGKVPYMAVSDLPCAVTRQGGLYPPGYTGEPVDDIVESYTINSADNLAADQVTMTGSSDSFGSQAIIWDYMDMVSIDEYWEGVGKSAGWRRKATVLLDEAKRTLAQKERGNNQTLRGGAKILTLTPFVGKLQADKIKMVGPGGGRIKMTCLNPHPTEDKPYYRFVHALPNATNPEEEHTFLWCDRPTPRLYVKDTNHSFSGKDGSIQIVYGDGEVIIEKEFFETKEEDKGFGNPRDSAGNPWIEIEYRRWALEEDEITAALERDSPKDNPSWLYVKEQDGVNADTFVGSHVYVLSVPDGAPPGGQYRRWKVSRIAHMNPQLLCIQVEPDRYGLLPGDCGLKAGSDVCIFDCNRIERKMLEVFLDAGFQAYQPFDQDSMAGLFHVSEIEAPSVSLKVGGVPIREYVEAVWSEPGEPDRWGHIQPPHIITPEQFGVERTNGQATFHLTETIRLDPGDRISVAGVDNTRFNGVWTITVQPNPSTVIVAMPGPDANGSSGILTPVGKTLTKGIMLPSSDDFEYKLETDKNHQQVLDEIKKYLPSNYQWWVDEYTCLHARPIEQLERGYTLDAIEKVEAVTSDQELKTAVRYRVRDVTLRNVATRTAGCTMTFNRALIWNQDEDEPMLNLPLSMWCRRNNDAPGSNSWVQQRCRESGQQNWHTWENMPQDLIDYMLWHEGEIARLMLDGNWDSHSHWELHSKTQHKWDGVWLFTVEMDHEYELKQINIRGGGGMTAGDYGARIALEVSPDRDAFDEVVPDFEFTNNNKNVAQFSEKDLGTGTRATSLRVRAVGWCYQDKHARHMQDFRSITIWPSDIVFGEAILGETEDFDRTEDKALAAKLNMGQPRWHVTPTVDEQGYHIARLMFGDIRDNHERLAAYAKAKAKETLYEMSKDFSPVSITGVRPDLRARDTVNVAALKAGFADTAFLVREVNHTSEGTVTAKLYPYRQLRWVYNPGTPVETGKEPFTGFQTAPANRMVEGAGPFPLTPAPRVAVCDPAGNPLADFTGPVTLSLLGGALGAALLGTLTAGAAAGVATFPDLAVSAASPGYALKATATVTYNGKEYPLTSQSHYFALSVPGMETLVIDASPTSVMQPVPAPNPDVTALGALVAHLTPRDGHAIAEYVGDATVSLVGEGTLSGTTTQPLGADGAFVFGDLAVDRPGTYSLRLSAHVSLSGSAVPDLVADTAAFQVLARSAVIDPGSSGASSVRFSLSIPLQAHIASPVPGPPEDGIYAVDLSNQLDGTKATFLPPHRVVPAGKSGLVVTFNGARIAPANLSVADGSITISWDDCNASVPGGAGDSLVAEFPYNYVP